MAMNELERAVYRARLFEHLADARVELLDLERAQERRVAHISSTPRRPGVTPQDTTESSSLIRARVRVEGIESLLTATEEMD